MYLVLDTNIFLHYRMFDEIDWKEFLETDKVTLVVPITVINELDNHKLFNQSSRIKKRAENVLRKLDQIHKRQFIPSNKVTLNLLYEEPRVDWGEHSLDPSSNDDRLIAELITLHDKVESNICLVCADYGLRLKAAAKNIDTKDPYEEWRISEKDERDKTIERLTREVIQLNDNLPDLRLEFEDANPETKVKHIEFNTQVPLFSEEDILKAVKQIRQKMEASVSRNNSLITGFIGGIQESEIKRYRNDVEEYISIYQEYMRELNEYNLNNALAEKVTLLLFNCGNAPANDIDIILRFPDGFDVLSEEDMGEVPKEPRRPTPPRTLAEQMAASLMMPKINLPLGNLHNLQPMNFNDSRPRIKKINSYEVTYSKNCLKHGFQVKLDPIVIRFAAADQVRPFGIDYLIIAGNVPKQIEGELHVIARIKGCQQYIE